MGLVCDSGDNNYPEVRKVSLVYDDGYYTTVGATAHELGHQ